MLLPRVAEASQMAISGVETSRENRLFMLCPCLFTFSCLYLQLSKSSYSVCRACKSCYLHRDLSYGGVSW